MATVRQLPSGNWQALVYVKGERIPFTDNSKTVVEQWAKDQEEAKKRGRWRDPRLGRIKLAAYHDIWKSGRAVEDKTREREDSTWGVWVEPQYGDWTLEELEAGREDVKTWFKLLIDDPDTGTWTILNIAKLLSKMFADAIDSGRMVTNPAIRLGLPSPPKKPPFFWTHDEAGAIVEAARPPYDLLIDFDLHVGPRVEELAGLLADCVNTRLALIHVVRVGVDGVLRDYPKTSKSHRTIPIPQHLVERFERQIHGKDKGQPVWTSPSGRMLDDNNFRNRVFNPARRDARTCVCDLHDMNGEPVLCDIVQHMVREGSPNDMRHTAASWAVMAGVGLYDVQSLLGHEKYSTTQMYAHLDPTKHNAVRAAWGIGGLTGALRRVATAGDSAPVPTV